MPRKTKSPNTVKELQGIRANPMHYVVKMATDLKTFANGVVIDHEKMVEYKEDGMIFSVKKIITPQRIVEVNKKYQIKVIDITDK